MNREEYKAALLNSGIGRYVELYAEGISPLLNRMEVEELFTGASPRNMNAIVVSAGNGKSMEFITRDYCFGTYVLPDNFVHISQQVPFVVARRKSIPDGNIDTFEKYCLLNEIAEFIYDLDGLLDFLEQEGIISD